MTVFNVSGVIAALISFNGKCLSNSGSARTANWQDSASCMHKSGAIPAGSPGVNAMRGRVLGAVHLISHEKWPF